MSMRRVADAVNRVLRPLGIEVSKIPPRDHVPHDMDEEFRPLYEQVLPYSMTPVEGLYAVYKAASYIAASGIPGDVVECGVWRGGASMLAALTFLRMADTERTLFLYDTFAGMTEPTQLDREVGTERAVYEKWQRSQRDDFNTWCYAPIEEVRANLERTGYPHERMRFVRGPVEETIPATVPSSIALLRLDTDWFESTYHELVHLFPRLVSGGVLIVDDYGQWAGAREAVDRYVRENGCRILLVRIPRGGCIAVKND